jgi:hypothetical protein
MKTDLPDIDFLNGKVDGLHYVLWMVGEGNEHNIPHLRKKIDDHIFYNIKEQKDMEYNYRCGYIKGCNVGMATYFSEKTREVY